MSDAARGGVSIRTVLFDLDGTLADTAPDLGFALNALLAEENLPPLPAGAIRPEASHGTRALLRLGFGLEPDDARFEPMRLRFLAIYARNLCRRTTLFPGMPGLLETLRERGYRLGIVTNKPAFLTGDLVRRLGLDRYTSCVVSGDTTSNPKPHPAPMLHACALTHSDPGECLYVGDAERDIEAGRRAGMKTLVALFGYLRATDDPGAWRADGMVQSPEEIIGWLARQARAA